MPSHHNQHHEPPTPNQQITNPDRKPGKIIVTHQQNDTHFLIWLAAILCTIIAIGVVIGGIVVFVGYIVIHPRVPTISIAYAHLDLLSNDYAGLLQTQLTIIVMAQNGNAKAHATFSDMRFVVGYQGERIAILVAQPFDVPKNSSNFLNYVVQSSSIPLTPEQMEEVDASWKRNIIRFEFKGNARTQWKLGPFGSVKFWCKLECQLRFHPLNGSYIPSRCTSQSK